jgi:hypothetical protein
MSNVICIFTKKVLESDTIFDSIIRRNDYLDGVANGTIKVKTPKTKYERIMEKQMKIKRAQEREIVETRRLHNARVASQMKDK